MQTNNKIKYISILFITFLVCSVTTFGQVPEEIVLGLNTGNAKLLSKYFNQNVELVVLDNDDLYSKAQAQQIVSNFFSNYTPEPEGFSIRHSGGKDGPKFIIGNLKTNKGSFRVSFLLKKNNDKDYIHQLRIEKQ